MPAQQACTWMMGALSALSLAHQRGIVHRDLKPDNLFVVADGRGGQTIKVLDFGIAKVMDAAGGMGSKTKTGVLLGTPGYMSPEQIKNSKGVDPRSDLWSVGIILYELLSGHEAFPADNEFTRLTLVLTQEVRPITDVAPHLAQFAPFFQRALSKDLQRRFQTAGEMAQALGAIIGMAPQSQVAPHTQGAPQHGTAVLSLNSPQMHAPMSGAPATMGAGAHPHAQQQRPNYSNPPPPQSFQPVVHSVSAVPSYPPPSAQQGPNTHISPGRPGSTLHTGSGPGPAVELMKPPPVGVPWWVVGAVGVATFVVGFIVGYFAH
jgi:serine/threonine-protein kinase